MNANELVEILKENPDFITSLQNRIEKQEIEIEALKDKLGIQDYSNNSLLKAVSKIKEQAKEIEVLNQSYKILFKHRIEQEKESELLKANLRHVADQLRGGVSKIQQKTMARVIEQTLEESK